MSDGGETIEERDAKQWVEATNTQKASKINAWYEQQLVKQAFDKDGLLPRRRSRAAIDLCLESLNQISLSDPRSSSDGALIHPSIILGLDNIVESLERKAEAGPLSKDDSKLHDFASELMTRCMDAKLIQVTSQPEKQRAVGGMRAC